MSHLWDGKTPSPLGEHFSKLEPVTVLLREGECTGRDHIRSMT